MPLGVEACRCQCVTPNDSAWRRKRHTLKPCIEEPRSERVPRFGGNDMGGTAM